MNTSDRNPVFVVGVYRSGTSLLHTLINQHPQIGLMYECNVLDFPATLSSIRLRGDWLGRQEFVNSTLSRHKLIMGGRLNGLEKIKTPEDLYHTFAEGKGARFWGEKSPAYARRLSRLVKEFPNGSFILIWRDPQEVFRSIQNAGKTDAYFRRVGMLHRVIQGHEEMARTAARLKMSGVYIHHVEYDDLVDNTEATTREICRFLEVEYHPDMGSLKNADFTGVYDAVHHEHLRQGTIVRRKHAPETNGFTLIQKLRRFNRRWKRLRGCAATDAPEPSSFELLYHRMGGAFFLAFDNCKRLAFEFLPLAWLQTYRDFKQWFIAGCQQKPAKSSTFPDLVRKNLVSILSSYGFLIGVVAMKYYSHTHLAFAPLYLVSPSFLTLIINRRWGGVMAVISASFWACLNFPYPHLLDHPGVLAWNLTMHLMLILTSVLLLDRIREDFSTRRNKQVLQS